MAKQEKSAAELYREQRKARIAKAAKKSKKKPISPEMGKKIGKVVAVIVVLAILATIGGVAASYTGFIEQHRIAVKVGENIEVNQPEYSFFYNNAYSLANQYASYGISYDTSKTPDVQEYTGDFGAIEGFPEDQTPMWTDYFEYYANQRLSALKASVAAAEERGLELDDADLADVQSSIDSNNSSAKTNGYSLSAYLRAYYGKGVSVKLYRSLLEQQALMSKLSDTKQAELKEALTKKQVEEAYQNNLSQYAAVSLRSYKVNAQQVADENGAETVNDETMAVAKKRADAISAAATGEKAFLAAVSKDAKANDDTKDYLKDDSLTLKEDAFSSDLSFSSAANEWLFSASRRAGDVYVDEDATSGYTVIFMTAPVHKAEGSKTYDVRHILVKFPSADTADAAEADETATVETINVKDYKDVVIDLDVNAETASNPATYDKAQNILKEYLEGDKTEDAFGELAKKYSEDSNASEGGIYRDVPKGQMVSEFENWALAKGRKAGDVGIVETTYGYHVMYFVGSSSTGWDDQIRTDLTENDLNTYFEDLSKDENFAVTVVSQKAIDDVQAFIVRLARNQIRNAANSVNG